MQFEEDKKRLSEKTVKMRRAVIKSLNGIGKKIWAQLDSKETYKKNRKARVSEL